MLDPMRPTTKLRRNGCINQLDKILTDTWPQDERIARGMNINKINVNGTKKKLKYGGPTDILPSPKASDINGYIVPKRTTATATVRIRLLIKRNVSLDEPE
tara:strand:+ start:140 stop:442 length:303 start_codon:yes stop_codon:yes gene_type:complete